MDSEAVAAAAASMEEEEEAPVKKHELVRQLQFAPGFHFVPTEEELVDIYLRGKIEGRKLPLDVIHEVSLLEWQPGKLVETYKAYGENKWYFFTKRKPSSSNKEEEPDRKVNVPGVTATWKASGRLMVIRRKGKPRDQVGTKRVLIYHSSDAEEDGKWSMHEYILTSNSKIGEFALYSIQRKQHSDTESGKTTKRKKAASAQQQKQETKPQHVPPQLPLTPHIPDHMTPQQQPPTSAYAPTSLQTSGPLQQQGYPLDGNQQYLGVSAPISAHACYYDQQCWYGDMSAQFNMQQSFCNQGEQPSLIWNQSLPPDSNVDSARYQPYQMENYDSFGVLDQLVYTGRYLGQQTGFFPHDTTYNNSNWEFSQDQLYQQGDGHANGVQDLYGFQSYDLQGHGAVLGQQTGYGSHDQFSMSFEGGAVASMGHDSVTSFSTDLITDDIDLIFSKLNNDDHPRVMVGGVQDGMNPDLQGQQDLKRLCGEQQKQTDDCVGLGSTL